jgi:hypothetical protein
MGVELVAPAKGKSKQNTLSLSEFELSDRGHVLVCPAGQKPLTSKKRRPDLLKALTARLVPNAL